MMEEGPHNTKNTPECSFSTRIHVRTPGDDGGFGCAGVSDELAIPVSRIFATVIGVEVFDLHAPIRCHV